ncbi:hypothetical protein OG252_33310 [Streptomyces sp. NBC_01352]|uniref:DUF6907 domain-containing protein n=1 Tax=Streptomyces sp. NBC_01352 TaxID=2903834 RepID=UPI002E307812|nr:hypothetical protein [Streptomyces sp. NBC_01352]
MSTPPPPFGPTEVFPCDENSEAFAVVRFAVEVSLDQLRTAIAIGHAEMSGTPPLAEMSVADIRREVEGHLAAGATINLYRETAEVVRRVNESGHLAELDAAIDRAYRPRPAPPVQSPEYGDGTVTLDTLDHGRITIPEPVWCRGHDGEQVVRRVDITHVGATTAGEFEGVEFLPARISWGPFAELRPEPYPLADVDEFPSMEPDELRELAAEVGLHAGRLYAKANELDRIRRAQP